MSCHLNILPTKAKIKSPPKHKAASVFYNYIWLPLCGLAGGLGPLWPQIPIPITHQASHRGGTRKLWSGLNAN